MRTSSSKPKALRKSKHRWTPEDDAYLAREWGELTERTMRQHLGRSKKALILRAWRLGLPRQSQGKVHVKKASVRVGIDRGTLQLILAECGLRVEDAAPVSLAPTRAGFRQKVVDVDAVAALTVTRDTRTLTLTAWARLNGGYWSTTTRRFARLGLRPAGGGDNLRYPIALMDEIAEDGASPDAGGPWRDLWRRVIATPDLPTAPWVAALAAWDLAHADDAGRAWIEHLPLRARELAAELATTIARPEPIVSAPPSACAPPAARSRRAA